MLVKYIDSNYIIERLQKPSWGEVEEPDFYITMASNRVKALIFPSEQGDPNNLASYTEEQQEAIKLATAIYTLWYFDTNYDFTNGSVSVNFGGVSMSESKTYNGEMVLPNVFDILKQANLIPTTETFIFSGENNLYADTAINPKSFKDLQQEVERQADVNIKQDAKLVALNDAIANIDGLKTEIWDIQAEQQEQDTKILTNTNNITTLKNDVKTFYGDLLNTQNKVAGIEYNYLKKQSNDIQVVNSLVDFYGNIVVKNNGYLDNVETTAPTSMVNVRHLNNTITPIDTKLTNTTDLLNQTIERLRTLKPFQYVGQYQAGTTYNINQVVSFNNNLYLSTEDNNTTQPPTDKWLLLNEDLLNIDLTDYYTKLEVDGIKNNLQNSITTNQTNITNLQNDTVKLSGAQNISGVKTITATTEALKFNSGTDNSAYISGYKSNNERIWYFGKGSSTSYNFVIGADKSDIKLEPKGKVDLSNKKIGWLADPTADQDAANKRYVDNNTLSKTLTTPQTVAGSVSFTQPLTVATPTANTHAANKQYVDDAIAGVGSSTNQINTNTTNIQNNTNSIQTNTNNITNLQNNYNTLNSEVVKLAGTQTITGQKTFSNAITITKTNGALQFKPGTNQSAYFEFYNGNTRIGYFGKGSSSNNNLTLGAQSGKLSIEASQGTEIHNPVQFGTEIKAGYGGLNVKFIPEDNSTKTLQFYNANANDQRRFKLLVPEPTEAQNPATKNYVDNAISNLQTNGNLGLNLRYQDLVVPNSPTKFEEGNTVKYWFTSISVPEIKFLSAVVNYQGQSNASTIQKYWDFSYSVASGSKVYFHFTADKNTNYRNNTPNWGQTKIRIFYIDSLNTRNSEPYTIA